MEQREAARQAAKAIRANRPSGTMLDDLRFLHLVAGEIEDMIHGEITVLRVSGSSWSEIGGVLGVSKQAAQQMHARRRG